MSGNAGVEGVRGLARLEKRVRVVGGAADHRPLRGEPPGTVGAHQIVVNRRPDLLVRDDRDLVLLVRRSEPVEEEQHRHARFECRHLRHQRQIVRLLHGRGGEHRPAHHARAHDIRVVAEDGQRLRRQRSGRDMQHTGRELARDLVHVGEHQQESLRRRERRRQGAALERAVHGTGRAPFRLHLLDDRNLTPDVRDALRGPGVGQLRHRGGWRDRKDGADLVDAIRDMGGRRVAVHHDRLGGHAASPD